MLLLHSSSRAPGAPHAAVLPATSIRSDQAGRSGTRPDAPQHSGALSWHAIVPAATRLSWSEQIALHLAYRRIAKQEQVGVVALGGLAGSLTLSVPRSRMHRRRLMQSARHGALAARPRSSTAMRVSANSSCGILALDAAADCIVGLVEAALLHAQIVERREAAEAADADRFHAVQPRQRDDQLAAIDVIGVAQGFVAKGRGYCRPPAGRSSIPVRNPPQVVAAAGASAHATCLLREGQLHDRLPLVPQGPKQRRSAARRGPDSGGTFPAGCRCRS